MSPDAWNKLKSTYDRKGLVLFLGAGVSMGSLVPNWSDLVSRMMECFPNETGGKPAFHDLRRAGYSLPAITEHILLRVDKSRFIPTLRECLYREFPYRNVDRIYGPEAKKFVEDTYRDNPTLAAVYDFAVHENNSGLFPNPLVHAIVSTNLDALLESFDGARHSIKGVSGQHRCLHTIESATHNRILGRISVYHPHGYLRFDRHKDDLNKEAAATVLSEHEYFDFYNRLTDVFTYTMLYLLREYPCLFVGMSLTDDNLRRLLFYSKRERESGRTREKRYPIDRGPTHFAILPDPHMGGVRFYLETTVVALGVQPLWVPTVAQIPGRIALLTREDP